MKIKWETTDGIMCGENGPNDLYIKLGPNDVIKEGAVHSVTKGYYNGIYNPETIGDIPLSFSPTRTFYNRLESEPEDVINRLTGFESPFITALEEHTSHTSSPYLRSKIEAMIKLKQQIEALIPTERVTDKRGQEILNFCKEYNIGFMPGKDNA